MESFNDCGNQVSLSTLRLYINGVSIKAILLLACIKAWPLCRPSTVGNNCCHTIAYYLPVIFSSFAVFVICIDFFFFPVFAYRWLLKMQASTASPVSNSTAPSNTATVTKSKEQILIQSECGCTSDLTSCIQFSFNKIERFKPGLINVNSVQHNQLGFHSNCSDRLFLCEWFCC